MVTMAYKYRFLYDRPYMHIPIVQCGNCYVDLMDDYDKGLVCPDCGAIFEDVTENLAYASPDWDKEDVIPDLWLTRETPIPRGSKIGVKILDNPDWPFMLTVNKHMVCLCQTREDVEHEIRELRAAIADHYALQDRKREENEL